MITRMCWAQNMLVGYIMSRVSSSDYIFAIEGVAWVQLVHSSLGDWNIFITILLSILPIAVILFCRCVSEMVVLSYSLIYLQTYLGNTLFPLLRCSLWFLHTTGYIMACRSCSFVRLQITPSHYHHADLSDGIELTKWLSGICCWVYV